jgi:Tol biopolymer transport system component
MSKVMLNRVVAASAGLAVALAAAGSAVAAATTTRVSVGPGGLESDGHSVGTAISAHGRFVAFGSFATNLVPGDSNGAEDVFVRDRSAGVTQRVSVGAGGQGNSVSLMPAISADGRYVAFLSGASNLVSGDTNVAFDAFVRDRQARTTVRVSVGSGGQQANGSTDRVAISADGRYVAFASDASNLVPGDTNATSDVFVRDLQTGTTRRVSVGSSGRQANGFSSDPALSADGTFVAFDSSATNLVPGDHNGVEDVFVRDLQTGVTRRVSVGTGGVGNGDSSRPSLSAGGRYVAFVSDATNLVTGDTNGFTDVFVRDRQAATTRRVSVGAGGQANGLSETFDETPTISGNGRYVAFSSEASNLVTGDTNGFEDVFVRDRQARVTLRVSLTSQGGEADGLNLGGSIAADGRSVAFSSFAQLVPEDTNGVEDIYVRDLG